MEIACGYGRWTEYLKDLCSELLAVDLADNCVQACLQRFKSCAHARFYKNDGISLDMVKDASVDFVFSFDSLVHADEVAMKGYLSQFPRILKDTGVAFLHHSNLGEYTRYAKIGRVPKLKKLLRASRVLERDHERDPHVDARKVEYWAELNGLRCISQEMVRWGTRRMFIDCLSTIVPKASPLSRDNRRLRNGNFMREARNLAELSRLYGIQMPTASPMDRVKSVST